MQAQTQQNRKAKSVEQLDAELRKCGLSRRSFPQSPRNFFKAISDTLYYDSRYFDQLIELCKDQLKRRTDNNTLPIKLKQQFENKTLIDDYYENPDLSGFIKAHLGLISLAYDRKIVVYYIAEEYLNSMVVNNSSNKHPPILLCRAFNSYSAVVSIESMGIAQMIKQRLGQKLMAHSFLISTKQNDQKGTKIFETPRRPHKKSLSLCDEMQYQQIFGTPINITFQNQTHSTKFISFETHFEDKDDLALLGECNINGKVQYPVVDKARMFEMSPPHPFHRAGSMRDISGSNNAAQKIAYQPNGSKRHTGRLKFFDQNKNYG